MSEWLLGFVAVYLLGRVFFYDVQIVLSGKSVQQKALLKRALWGILLVLFAPDLPEFLFGYFWYLLLLLADSFLKSKKPARNRWYYALHWLLLLFVWFLILPWFGRFAFRSFNPLNYSHLCRIQDFQTLLLVFDGFLVTQKEGTIWIRLVLQRLRALPRQENRRRDRQEYELGRVIGLLERTFLYFLIIWNQIGAIAVLIALKSLARFKELEDRTFAEYFLIGSLLSILAATIPAVVVRLVK